ncbi:MAG: hypothetical protein ACM3N9_00660 [Syntrophothermus sp.]
MAMMILAFAGSALRAQIFNDAMKVVKSNRKASRTSSEILLPARVQFFRE